MFRPKPPSPLKKALRFVDDDLFEYTCWWVVVKKFWPSKTISPILLWALYIDLFYLYPPAHHLKVVRYPTEKSGSVLAKVTNLNDVHYSIVSSGKTLFVFFSKQLRARALPWMNPFVYNESIMYIHNNLVFHALTDWLSLGGDDKVFWHRL